jgi:hypothetical protein
MVNGYDNGTADIIISEVIIDASVTLSGPYLLPLSSSRWHSLRLWTHPVKEASQILTAQCCGRYSGLLLDPSFPLLLSLHCLASFAGLCG